jgi:uncharacterized protein (DUF3084 family)
MNKGLLKDILIVLLVTIVVFSIYKYKVLLSEKYELLNTLFQVRARAGILEKEKQNLLQDIEKRKGTERKLITNLKASRSRLAKLFAENNKTENALDESCRQISLLKIENINLKEQKDKVFQENESLKERLSSIEALTKAIQELNKNQNQAGNTQQGNKGYLIKNSQFTYPAKVKIEVVPASQKE